MLHFTVLSDQEGIFQYKYFLINVRTVKFEIKYLLEVCVVIKVFC